MPPNLFGLFAVLIVVVIGLVLEIENEFTVGLVPVKVEQHR